MKILTIKEQIEVNRNEISTNKLFLKTELCTLIKVRNNYYSRTFSFGINKLFEYDFKIEKLRQTIDLLEEYDDMLFNQYHKI